MEVPFETGQKIFGSSPLKPSFRLEEVFKLLLLLLCLDENPVPSDPN